MYGASNSVTTKRGSPGRNYIKGDSVFRIVLKEVSLIDVDDFLGEHYVKFD